jgi:hypothetical protein
LVPVSTASDIKTAVVKGFLNEGRTVKADADRGANKSSKKVLERVIVSVLFCVVDFFNSGVVVD